jgi:hypothetical protein
MPDDDTWNLIPHPACCGDNPPIGVEVEHDGPDGDRHTIAAYWDADNAQPGRQIVTLQSLDPLTVAEDITCKPCAWTGRIGGTP